MCKYRLSILCLIILINGSTLIYSKDYKNVKPPIKVGILHSLTGTMAFSEKSLVDAIKLAINEINAKGGADGRMIVPITEDGSSDWPTFAKKAEKLITVDKVSSIFGCWTSASRKSVIPIVEKYNNLLWYPIQYEGFETSPNVIYTGAAPNQQIIPAVDWSLKHLGKKFFLLGSDYIFPREANRIIKKYLKIHGGVLLGEEYRPLSNQDFKDIIKMVKSEKPDVIINTVNGDSNIGLFLELSNTFSSGNYSPAVMSLSIAEDELSNIGTKLTIGHYCAWNYFQSIDSPANQTFVNSFKKAYGNSRVTDDPIVNAYFQVYLFASAVSKAKSSNPVLIKNAVKGIKINSPCGDVMIDKENQHTWKYARIGKILNYGQFEIVWSSDSLIKPDPYLKSIFKSSDESLTYDSEFKDIKKAEKDIDVNALICFLDSKNVLIREQASLSFSQLGAKASSKVRELSSHLDDTDLLVVQNILDALDKMDIKAFRAMPDIIIAMSHSSSGVRFRALKIILNLTDKIQEQQKIEALPMLENAISAINKYMPDKESIGKIEQTITYLKNIEKNNQFNHIYNALSKNPLVWFICLYILVFMIIGVLGVRFFPLWILKMNMLLQPDTKKEVKFLNLTIPLQYFLIVGFFQSNNRVLDSWVKKYISIARVNFLNIDTVKYRKDYVPVPVTINNINFSTIEPQLIDNTTSQSRWCILIQGQGGTGKTALACQMGIWSMEEQSENRLCSDHQMIPILIEPNTDSNILSNIDMFKKTVKGYLSTLIRTNTSIPDFLIDHLLQKQRLLIIIDDLTGLSNSSWSLPTEYHFSLFSLIVTSRVYGSLGSITPDIISPQHIHGDNLLSFINAYITKKGHRDLFTDNDIFTACIKLGNVVGKKNLDEKQSSTVLFAKMFADQLIGNKLHDNGLMLPKDIPNLMLGYINELNRNNKEIEFPNQLIHHYSRLIAWEFVKDKFHPMILKRDTIQMLLGDNLKLYTYFEKQLGIIQASGIDYSGVKFSIDPLAEYLSALHIINLFKGDEVKWNDLLNTLRNRIKNDDIRGFVIGLRDCSLTKGQDEGIPSFVAKRLDEILGDVCEVEDVIKVGILHSLTGNMAISERSLVDSITLAISEINNNGGILGRKIICIIEDGASDRQTFKNKAKKLILEDHVCSIFGCWTSADRKIVLPVIEEFDNLLWYPLQYEGFESSKNIIYSGAAPNQQIIPAIDWCLENIGKKCFLIGSNYEFPRIANDIIKAYLKKEYSIIPLAEEYIELGDRDFKDIVSKIKILKPDFIFNTVNGESNMGLFTELSNAGITSKEIPVMSVSIAEDELLSIGSKKSFGHYCAWNYFQTITTPKNKFFVNSFKETFGELRVTDDPIEAAYSQVFLFATALQKAGVINPIAIRDAAKGLSYSTPGGEILIDEENQHTWKVAHIAKINLDCQFEIIWSSTAAIRPDPYLKQLFPDGLNV